MNKDQTIVNSMAKAIVSLFEKFLALWSGNEAVEESLNKLKAYQGGVDTAAYEQVNKTPMVLQWIKMSRENSLLR